MLLFSCEHIYFYILSLLLTSCPTEYEIEFEKPDAMGKTNLFTLT